MRRPKARQLRIKIFADGADFEGLRLAAADPRIRGFTTNPALMRAAGVRDYKAWALRALELAGERPVSFEVLGDDSSTIYGQACEIASWGSNVYVKVPVSNTKGEFSGDLIRALSGAGIKINVTAVMTPEQVAMVAAALAKSTPAMVSVFAGRIADTGRDPMPYMRKALRLLESRPQAELLWASSRELLNIFQANSLGCHIITITNDLLKKLALVGRDLDDYSRETVAMFYSDGRAAGYQIATAAQRVTAAQSPESPI